MGGRGYVGEGTAKLSGHWSAPTGHDVVVLTVGSETPRIVFQWALKTFGARRTVIRAQF